LTPIPTTLRPYQNEARYQVNTLLNAGRHPIVAIPTGTGKTKTAVQIISDQISLGRRVWVLVPQDEIFGQWVLEATAAGLNPGTIDQRGVLGCGRGVYICMPLSLINILSRIPEAIHPDVIIIDEAHHSAADTWDAIFRFFPNASRLGLTATPRRTDRRPLTPYYTDIVQTITMADAIEAGYLARPLCIVPKQYHLDVSIKDGDYDPAEQARLLGEPQIIGDVLGSYRDIFAGLPVLVACSTFEHANAMTTAFRKAGWKWAHIHSKLPCADRKRMLRDIRSGRLNGLCTVGIGIEGMDIPGLYGLIWLRRTLALTIYLQFSGRVLRPMPGKQYGVILDPVGNLFIHGFPEADRIWTLEGIDPPDPSEAAPTMKECPFCGTYNAVSNEVCHFCGRVIVGEDADAARKDKNRRHLPAMVDGELVAVTSDGMAQSLADRAERIRRESAEELSAEDEARARPPEILTRKAKADILRGGLFENRRPLFQEAIGNLK